MDIGAVHAALREAGHSDKRRRTLTGEVTAMTVMNLCLYSGEGYDAAASAAEIAAVYAERWQAELAYYRLKCTLRGNDVVLRGQTPGPGPPGDLGLSDRLQRVMRPGRRRRRAGSLRAARRSVGGSLRTSLDRASAAAGHNRAAGEHVRDGWAGSGCG
nr:transposase domain-containing protein [Sphaerimonospora thailandensis]